MNPSLYSLSRDELTYELHFRGYLNLRSRSLVEMRRILSDCWAREELAGSSWSLAGVSESSVELDVCQRLCEGLEALVADLNDQQVEMRRFDGRVTSLVGRVSRTVSEVECLMDALRDTQSQIDAIRDHATRLRILEERLDFMYNGDDCSVRPFLESEEEFGVTKSLSLSEAVYLATSDRDLEGLSQAGVKVEETIPAVPVEKVPIEISVDDGLRVSEFIIPSKSAEVANDFFMSEVSTPPPARRVSNKGARSRYQFWRPKFLLSFNCTKAWIYADNELGEESKESNFKGPFLVPELLSPRSYRLMDNAES